MALIPKVVTNLLNEQIVLNDVKGLGSTAVKIPALASNLDLSNLAMEVDLAKSAHLLHLQDAGLITVVSTFDTAELEADLAVGGDLSGNLPNPSVAKLGTTGASVVVNTAIPPTVNQILTAINSTHATWQTRFPANVITVAPSGGQYTTLAAAIAAVGTPSSETIINIAPGIYTETPVTIPDFVDVVSNGPVTLNYSSVGPAWTIAAGNTTHLFEHIGVANGGHTAILVSGNLTDTSLVTPSGTSLATGNGITFINCVGIGSPALHISGTRSVTGTFCGWVGIVDRAITSDTSATISFSTSLLENFNLFSTPNKDVVYLGATSNPYSSFSVNLFRTPNGGFAINAPSSVTVILGDNGLHHITNDTAAAPGYGTNIVPAPATGAHLVTNTSQLRFTDGNQASGKLLTSDASGNASWQSPSTVPASIVNWILSGDALIQFSPINGPSPNDNPYSGPFAGVSVTVAVTNGVGVVDPFNQIATVLLSVTGGTASSPLINGSSSPVLLTVVNGVASATISASGAGTVLLGLSGGNTTLDRTDTATVTLS